MFFTQEQQLEKPKKRNFFGGIREKKCKRSTSVFACTRENYCTAEEKDYFQHLYTSKNQLQNKTMHTRKKIVLTHRGKLSKCVQ